MSFGNNSFSNALKALSNKEPIGGSRLKNPIANNLTKFQTPLATLNTGAKAASTPVDPRAQYAQWQSNTNAAANRPTDRGNLGDYGFGSGATGGGGGAATNSNGGSSSTGTVAPRDSNTTDAGSDGQYDSGQSEDTASGTPFSLGGTTYSALGLQTLLNNPYSLAQAFLNDLGSNYNTPTMMAAMGQFPALAGTLDLMLTGDQRMTGDTIDDGATAQRLVDLMRGQLTPGGGIDAYSLINKMLNLATTEVTSPGSDNENQVKSALGALLSGVNSSGAAVGSQVNTVNDLIKVALVNSNPAMAASIAAMLDYYGNSYITQAAKISDNNPIPSYAQWLRDQGLIFR